MTAAVNVGGEYPKSLIFADWFCFLCQVTIAGVLTTSDSSSLILLV